MSTLPPTEHGVLLNKVLINRIRDEAKALSLGDLDYLILLLAQLRAILAARGNAHE